MPGGDGTGPAGLGPMTGRAAGYCAGYEVPGYATPTPGRGLGFGRGRGFGRGMGLGFRGGRWGRWATPYAHGAPPVPYVPPYGAVPTREQQLDALQGQAEYLGDALADIRTRISELEAETKSEE